MFEWLGVPRSGRKSRRTYGSGNRARLQGIETLEPRRVLASVSDVLVSSTEWTSSYLDAIGDDGYVPDTVTSINVDQIIVRFNGAVSVGNGDFEVKGVDGSYGFSLRYDAHDHAAVLTLDNSLSRPDKIVVEVDGRVVGGGDYEASFDVLPGDVDGNGTVDQRDYVQVDQVDGTSYGHYNYDPRRDLDGTGAIDFGDLMATATHFYETLPSGDPSTNDRPIITEFWAEEGEDGVWVFHGRVEDSDPGDDPQGWTVEFFGALEGHYATVEADGTFRLEVSLGSDSGEVMAMVQDNSGEESNIALIYI